MATQRCTTQGRTTQGRTTQGRTGTVKKTAAKKPVAKKAPAKTATAKKTVAKKPAAKTAAKRPAASRISPKASPKASPKTSRKAASPKTAPRKTTPRKTASGKSAPRKAAAPRVSVDEILGQIVRLMTQSPRHRHLFLADLEHRVVPPLRLGQCRVLRGEDGQPLAYAAWARVSAAVQKRLEAGVTNLKPEDWNSGPHPWLIDLAAPPQAVPRVLAELERTVFKGEKVRTMMEKPKSVGVEA